jgi:hypothetical protein
MANAMFGPGLEGFATAEIDWDTAAIKVAMVRGYTFSAAHKFVSEVVAAGGTLHAISGALANKSFASGVLDADNLTFVTPAANASNHYLLLYQASAVTGGADVATTAQRVIAWIDTAANLPIIPNGGNKDVNWDDSASKIIRL